MKPRVFIDTNVFIFAKEFPQSNSAKIIDLLNENEIEVIICEKILKEVYNYFRKYYSKELADKSRHYLLESCIFIPGEEVIEEKTKLKGKIKEKDLEQLATVKHFEIKHLISYDGHYNPFQEYITPKSFIKLIHLKPAKSEY